MGKGLGNTAPLCRAPHQVPPSQLVASPSAELDSLASIALASTPTPTRHGTNCQPAWRSTGKSRLNLTLITVILTAALYLHRRLQATPTACGDISETEFNGAFTRFLSLP